MYIALSFDNKGSPLECMCVYYIQLSSDSDSNVRYGAELLDRLMKVLYIHRFSSKAIEPWMAGFKATFCKTFNKRRVLPARL